MELIKTFLKSHVISITLIFVIILFTVFVSPIISHHIQVSKIKNQIEKIQLQIELNQEQRAVCKNNMDLWHAENEENRKILNDLMLQYNNMVGIHMQAGVATATTSRGE